MAAHEDYAEVIKGAIPELVEVQGIIMGSEVGPEIAYYLGRNPEEFDRIKDLRADEIIEAAQKAGTDDLHPITVGVDTAVEATFEAAQWIDSIAQSGGAQTIDASTDITRVPRNLTPGANRGARAARYSVYPDLD